ncbi:MAG: hypothetical protein RR216_03280 [Pseudoflavonifractor sp.]
MTEDAVRDLSPGQVFFDYGPVSMVVTAMRDGNPETILCRSAFSVIEAKLGELSAVLPLLMQNPRHIDPAQLTGTPEVMLRAVLATGDPLLTPMATVAGVMSDAVADYLFSQGATKVIANNGGDIALRLAPHEHVRLGIVTDLARGTVDQVLDLPGSAGVGGVATSGLGGRSFTLGIASAVTVFSARCVAADALATLLANKTYLDLPAVHTCLAGELSPESDIADLMVVTSVDPLTPPQIDRALTQALDEAALQYQKGNLMGMTATVQGRTVCFDPLHLFNDQPNII